MTELEDVGVGHHVRQCGEWLLKGLHSCPLADGKPDSLI